MIPNDLIMPLAFFVYIIIGAFIYTFVCDDDDSFGLLFMTILFWPIPVAFMLVCIVSVLLCIVVVLICMPFACIYESVKKNKNKDNSNT